MTAFFLSMRSHDQRDRLSRWGRDILFREDQTGRSAIIILGLVKTGRDTVVQKTDGTRRDSGSVLFRPVPQGSRDPVISPEYKSQEELEIGGNGPSLEHSL